MSIAFAEIFLHRPAECANCVSGFAPNGRLLFSAPADRGTRTAAGGFAPNGRLLFSVPADRGTRTAAGGFAPNGRLLFLHRLTRAHELPQAGSPLTGGFFSCTADRGTRTAAGGFAPNGRLLFLRRLTGVRELPQASSPLTGGVFFAEIQRWGFAVCGRRGRCGARRGDDAVPTAVGKKEGTPAVSLPL